MDGWGDETIAFSPLHFLSLKIPIGFEQRVKVRGSEAGLYVVGQDEGEVGQVNQLLRDQHRDGGVGAHQNTPAVDLRQQLTYLGFPF